MQSTQLSNVEQNTVTLTVTDFDGRARLIDGVPVWLSEDPTVVTVSPSPDGMSAVITTVGIVGTTRVNVVVDTDLGGTVLHQTGTFEVVVTESGEVNFTFTFGTPTHR